MKHLFEEVKNSNIPIRTSRYVQNLELPFYMFGWQYDAHECLLYILGKVYPRIKDEYILEVDLLESGVWQDINCRKRTEAVVKGIDVAFELNDSVNIETVAGLLTDL